MRKNQPYPVASITNKGTSGPTDTGSSVVVSVPFANGGIGGFMPQAIRIAVSSGAAYVRLNPAATSATVTTGDTIVTSTEALYLPCVGMHAVAARAVLGAGTPGVVQISALEDGVIIPSPTAIG